MRINNNTMAQNTHRQYGINNANISKSTEKLSSGYRINRAGDDAAGLAISEKMRAQIRGLNMASKNSQDATSLIQTAEGALQETHNILQRMRELATQSSSDTNETSIDRNALNLEFQQLKAEIDDTAGKTKFNDMGLIDGSFAKNLTSASTPTTDYKSAWASTGTAAGTYTVTSATVTTVPAVAGAAGSAAAIAGAALTETGAGNVTAIAFADGAAQDESLNGAWNFSFADGKFMATNSATNEKRTASATQITASGTTSISFGNLGNLTFTADNSGVINPGDISNFTGSVTISGKVTAKAATTKEVITLNGEEVDLQVGQSTILFNNSGVTVNLASGFAKGDADANGLGGSITVSKSSNAPFVVQTGANQGDELSVSIEKMDASTLGVKDANISNRLDASAAITQTNTAINLVSTQRASLGALQNRLNHKISNLDTSSENLQAAESRIRDVDMAKEMTTFTKNNILFQASTAMLAQANAAPQGVLQLLG